MGVVSDALGLSLIIEETYAYFISDQIVSNNTLATGTLDIKNILIKVAYTANNLERDNQEYDFGKHI